MSQKIIPHIWLDGTAEDAATFYTGLFHNSRIIQTAKYTEVGQEIHGQAPGSVMTVEFEIEGFRFMTLNGGPIFAPNASISFFVNCDSKEEVDRLWAELSQDGQAMMPLQKYDFSEYYGWIQDRYGVSWQLTVAKDDAPAPKIMPSLLFTKQNAGKAEEAIDFYVSIFNNAKKGFVAHYQEAGQPDEQGMVMYADFTLEGQQFAAMDSTEADAVFGAGVSLLVECEDQAEIDDLWGKLSAVKEAEQCGWLADKFGVSWQIAPKGMNEMLGDGESESAKRAMQAMLNMKKIDIAALKAAADDIQSAG